MGSKCEYRRKLTDEIMGDVTGFEGNLVTVPNLFTVENIDRNDAETNMLGGTGVHYNSRPLLQLCNSVIRVLCF